MAEQKRILLVDDHQTVFRLLEAIFRIKGYELMYEESGQKGIVMKVPPADMEMAITADPLFEQAMVIGDNRPYLSALLVLDPGQWALLAGELNVDPDGVEACNSPRACKTILEHVARQISAFPGYASIRRIRCLLEPWSIENGLITPTLKLKRNKVCERFAQQIDGMYEDH